MFITHSLFKQSQTQPEHIAFNENERQLSYHDFYCQALCLSHSLQAHIKHDDRIAIFLPRGIDAAISIYATLLSGVTYVPLDVQNPITRLIYIIEDVQPSCIIGSGERPSWCPATLIWVDFDAIQLDKPQPITPASQPENQPHKEQLAAILYTSGSTGKPKGVAISHRAIEAFVHWSSAQFAINCNDRIASLAPFHFDLSLFDLFSSVYRGASTYFIPQRLTMSPKKLVDWLESESITTWYTVPSILNFMTMRGGLSPERLPAFKHILFAGEVFPLNNLKKLLTALPHIEFFNLFGPTETNVCCYWQVQSNQLDHITQIPIGIAACSAQLEISEHNELLVQGPCLMSGYWHKGKLQKNNHPKHHTGDKVSQNNAQEFLYHGRIDRMIKSSGYRIEPAEIEAKINQFKDVHESLVFGEPDSISGQRLVAIVAGQGIDIKTLRSYLKQQLPIYMQPYKVLQTDTFPHLSNGKIDCQSLMAMMKQSGE